MAINFVYFLFLSSREPHANFNLNKHAILECFSTLCFVLIGTISYLFDENSYFRFTLAIFINGFNFYFILFSGFQLMRFKLMTMKDKIKKQENKSLIYLIEYFLKGKSTIINYLFLKKKNLNKTLASFQLIFKKEIQNIHIF